MQHSFDIAFVALKHVRKANDARVWRTQLALPLAVDWSARCLRDGLNVPTDPDVLQTLMHAWHQCRGVKSDMTTEDLLEPLLQTHPIFVIVVDQKLMLGDFFINATCYTDSVAKVERTFHNLMGTLHAVLDVPITTGPLSPNWVAEQTRMSDSGAAFDAHLKAFLG